MAMNSFRTTAFLLSAKILAAEVESHSIEKREQMKPREKSKSIRQ
jgi:hypothetical protein